MQSQDLPAIIYTQEPVSSCLIVTTYIKQVDELKLVEAASPFSFKNEHRFSIKQ